ncbi:hypothetical protein VTK73DRAFT_1352 [Phialemonium thermophilum]|uniref:Uncharacterized protein n=1 Tax=Phialemonium thermophilum TaxID=223376 RepID=A0ABR3VTK5_9PEZI
MLQKDAGRPSLSTFVPFALALPDCPTTRFAVGPGHSSSHRKTKLVVVSRDARAVSSLERPANLKPGPLHLHDRGAIPRTSPCSARSRLNPGSPIRCDQVANGDLDRELPNLAYHVLSRLVGRRVARTKGAPRPSSLPCIACQPWLTVSSPDRQINEASRHSQVRPELPFVGTWTQGRDGRIWGTSSDESPHLMLSLRKSAMAPWLPLTYVSRT